MQNTMNTAVVFTVAPEPRLTERQILNRIRKYEDAKRREKEAKAEAAALRKELEAGRVAFDDSTDAYALMLTPYEKPFLDTKALAADHPDLYAQYLRTRSESRFTARTK